MKTKKIRKVMSVLIAAGIVTAMYAPSFAEESKSSGSSEYDNADIINEMSTPEFKEKLDGSIAYAQDFLNSNDVERVSVKVTNDIILSMEMDTSVSNSKLRSTYEVITTGSLLLRDVFGVVIVTLKSTGVFSCDGKLSKPTDAYGTYKASWWKLSTDSFKSPSGASSYARTNFNGELDIGIAPIDITLQSFSYSGKIICDAYGECTQEWS